MKARLGVAALLLVVAAAEVGAAAAPSASAATGSAIVVSASPLDSGDLAAGEALHVQVALTNRAALPTAPLTATLAVDRSAFTSRDALADWFSSKSKTSTAAVVTATAAVTAIPGGQSSGLQLDADPTALPFGARGVYGISVQITSGRTVLGTGRSAVVWNASGTAAVPVAIALPLTVPASAGGFLTSTELSQDTGPTGILTRELADVENSQLAIGIDPRVLASIRVLGNTAPASAVTWLKRLEDLPNETFPLQWADADLTAPLHAGASTVVRPKSLAYAIDPKLFPATPASTPTPTPTSDTTTSPVPTSASLVTWNYTLPELGWPAVNSVEPSDLSTLAAAGITTTILDSSNVDGLGSRGLSGASGKSGVTAIAVSDDTLSAYLGSALQSSNRATSTEALTQISATLALIGIQSGSTPRTVLLTLGRNWAVSGVDVVHVLSEIYVSPWVTSAVLSSALAEAPTALRLDKDTESADRIALVSGMLAAERRVVRFAPVAQIPDAITSGSRLQLLSILSNEWSDTPSAWTAAAKSYITDADKVVHSVQVARSSTILGLADQLELPITITNGLDQDVTVNLLVRPTTPQVSIAQKDRLQTITLGANSQRRVQIPIQALSNGKARLVVTLSSATGVPIGTAVTLKVNVQAGWETLGTLVFVALIVALFGFGIFTNIRKRRHEATDEAEA